jgi:ABC-2 type transport system permease protein
MRRRLSDIVCVWEIHFARLRAEAGPFLLAAVAFPSVMYMFAGAVADEPGRLSDLHQVGFLAGSIVFSLSLTAVSWLGYLLLENRFTGRLKLFATLPLAPSSYVIGVLLFAIVQAAAGTGALLIVARVSGVTTALRFPFGVISLVGLIVVTVLCVCGVSVIVAARARSFSEGSLMTDALGAGLVFLAPVYYQPGSLPRILQVLSLALPTTYAARGVRTVLAGGGDVGRELLILAVMASVTLSLGFRAMRWSEE